jgi:hypothetical protein
MTTIEATDTNIVLLKDIGQNNPFKIVWCQNGNYNDHYAVISKMDANVVIDYTLCGVVPVVDLTPDTCKVDKLGVGSKVIITVS